MTEQEERERLRYLQLKKKKAMSTEIGASNENENSGGMGQILDQYKKSQTGSPQDLLLRANDLITKGAKKTGEFTEETLTEQGIPSSLSKVAGKFVQYSPDIVSLAVPGGAPSKAMKAKATDMARRSLGYSKRFLKDARMQKQAQEAAEVALERGVIPKFGAAEPALDRAMALGEKRGKTIGRFLRSQKKKLNTSDAISSLEGLKPGKSGGYYDDINKQIDKAIDTVKSYGDEMSFDEANKVKKIFQDIAKFSSTSETKGVQRSIAGKFREFIDDSLEKVSGGGKRFETFKRAKMEYGASRGIEDALRNRISAESGNNMFSPTSAIGALTQAASGNYGGAVGMLGLIELAKRRGTGSMANFLYSGSRNIPLASPGAINELSRIAERFNRE